MDNWIVFSVIATFATTLITIIIRYLNDFGEKKYLEAYMLISFLFINVLLMIYLAFQPKKWDIRPMKNKPIIFLFLLALSLLAIVTVYFSSKAHMLAPNPAYSSTIINFNIVLVLILSMILFKSPINFYTGLGMAFVLLGVIFIALNSDNKTKN